MYQVVDNLSHQAGAHALRAGVDFLFNDDTITYPRSVRGSYTFSSLANFLAGALQRLHADVRRPGRLADESRTSASTRRTNGRSARGLTLNLGLRYDLQFLAADRHRHEQRLAARRLRLVAVGVARPDRSRQRRALLRPRAAARGRQRAPVGRQHDRPRPACTSRACRASFPRRPARRCFPNILPARLLTTTLVNFTTMDRNLQNAYSRQASVEVERALGARTHGQRRLPVPPRRATC